MPPTTSTRGMANSILLLVMFEQLRLELGWSLRGLSPCGRNPRGKSLRELIGAAVGAVLALVGLPVGRIVGDTVALLVVELDVVGPTEGVIVSAVVGALAPGPGAEVGTSVSAAGPGSRVGATVSARPVPGSVTCAGVGLASDVACEVTAVAMASRTIVANSLSLIELSAARETVTSPIRFVSVTRWSPCSSATPGAMQIDWPVMKPLVQVYLPKASVPSWQVRVQIAPSSMSSVQLFSCVSARSKPLHFGVGGGGVGAGCELGAVGINVGVGGKKHMGKVRRQKPVTGHSAIKLSKSTTDEVSNFTTILPGDTSPQETPKTMAAAQPLHSLRNSVLLDPTIVL
jgi:hypothetical protein